ncbi:hypothetical protein Pint_25308 [Pistacia integerrima]|uniref:Uncharacterized protein n=1 Tax=Pistacia integerrima TaxID=434235 RepID=A0ACC0YCL4_9ROSI|nr:hypothetical protein Pint_25308 [Pistacia integerrima]
MTLPEEVALITLMLA